MEAVAGMGTPSAELKLGLECPHLWTSKMCPWRTSCRRLNIPGPHPDSDMTTKPPCAGDITSLYLCFPVFKSREQPLHQEGTSHQDSSILSSRASSHYRGSPLPGMDTLLLIHWEPQSWCVAPGEAASFLTARVIVTSGCLVRPLMLRQVPRASPCSSPGCQSHRSVFKSPEKNK